MVIQAKKSGNDARLIIKLLQGVYIELKADGTIEAFDSYLEHPIGYTPGELCGKKWSDVFLPMETDQAGGQNIQDVFVKNGYHKCMSQIQTKADDTLYVEWYFQSVRNSPSGAISVLGVGQDVSSRMAGEKELCRSYCKLLEKNRVLTCMYRIAQMAVDDSHSFGATLQSIIDLIPQAFEYPEKVTASIRLDEKSYQTPGFESSRNRYGKDITVQGDVRGRVEVGYLKTCRGAPCEKKVYSAMEIKLMESATRKMAFIITRKEADEKKQTLKEQLRHADRLATIGQLAAGMAHELNNPLGDILGFAQLASNYPDLPEPAYQDLVKIVKSTLYAREVIKKVLLFSRQTQPREARTNLNKLIEDWVDFIEFRCAQNDIEIVLEMTQNLPSVSGDPAQLSQVLINLVVNAIHAMPAGGILTIKTKEEPKTISMVVQDTGIGIEDDIKDKIFLPFFTTKEVDQGTGLGLSVVYGIIKEHGGTVTVDSRVGVGSTFEIKLPL